jgi:hypothetical protein
VGVTISLLTDGATEHPLWHEYFDPARNPAHRALVSPQIPVPPGAGRTIILRTDYGPTGDGQYDWPLFGRFQAPSDSR